MWVLEARKDAEKVWYPVIWEEKKDASNVIDYDIHDEITVGSSSVLNANNDTTTGMATVIPWVNAPKLLMDTSIYEPVPVEKTVVQTMRWQSPTRASTDNPSVRIREFITSSSTWTKQFEYFDSPDWALYSWMKAPYRWTYKVDATYVGTSSSYRYQNDWRIVKWWYPYDETVHLSYTGYTSTNFTESFEITLNKWDVIAVFMTMEKSWSYYSERPRIEMTITKIS